MNNLRKYALCMLIISATAVWSQQNANGAASPATGSTSQLPRLVRFSGTLKDVDGNPLTGIIGVTFSLYTEQNGGVPLWLETQNVQPDKNGHYTVQLGSTKPDGLPMDLFASEQAQWLGVQAQGQAEQARVLLLSVPYALKAGDAETLGGKPASAFALASLQAATGVLAEPGSLAGTGSLTGDVQKIGSTAKQNSLAAISGSGTTNYIPLWTSSTALGNSSIFENTTNKDIGIGTTTPAAALDVKGTVNASTSFNLAGQTFALGSYSLQNAFLGFSGNSTVTGTFNTASGRAALHLDTTGSYNTAIGADALLQNKTGNYNTASGYSALTSNTTGGENTAGGYTALYSNTTGEGNTAGGTQALYSNTTGSGNAASGDVALYYNTTGNYNTASGELALYYNTGSFNTALGHGAGIGSKTGSNNTFLGANSEPGPDNLSNATAIGTLAEVDESNAMVLGEIKGVNGAAASTNVGIGTTAPTYTLEVSSAGARNAEMAMVSSGTDAAISVNNTASGGREYWIDSGSGAAGIGAGNFAIYDRTAGLTRLVVSQAGNVGIGTNSPDDTLSVNGSADKPGGGSWGTFSDGRLKTLNGSFNSGLSQVLKIHPVRYRYKADNPLGIRDAEEHIGVVAQEVQQVIPEAVTENSKGYLLVNNDPIIWAMLNAIKEQQGEFRQQHAELAKALRQIKQQQSLLRAQNSAMRSLEAEIHDARKTLRKVKAQLGSAQPALVAAK